MAGAQPDARAWGYRSPGFMRPFPSGAGFPAVRGGAIAGTSYRARRRRAGRYRGRGSTRETMPPVADAATLPNGDDPAQPTPEGLASESRYRSALIIFFALGVPIAVSILLASIIGMLLALSAVDGAQQMFVGIDNFLSWRFPFQTGRVT
ncbi:hypothetical protein DSL92_02145 [Billgrantia gudaonensis]|uniref:Uncharacterized protein n=1 Tax=Billgrantia gudaonensis TaxID=376427 RepID=A0A432JL45_9GAMM|nr:hypothetical protein DSL92_02145 [Halomonas gudaonensis]